MLKKNNYFQSYSLSKKKYNTNVIKTKKAFKLLCTDIVNFNIPLLSSYETDYNFDFSPETVKKFSKYENIILFGMGGSILGTKSIYSFLREKIKIPHTLSELVKLTNKDMELIAPMALNDPCTPSNPKKTKLEDMKLMYEYSLQGKLF